MNVNKVKKIAVKFPNFVNPSIIESEGKRLVLKFKEARNINLELMSQEFARESAISVGARKLPHIEGFNCTMLNDIYIPGYFAMQFTFASGEEKKVSRLIEKYNGQQIQLRDDLQQWGTSETNLSGKEYNYERVNEFINVRRI